MALVVQVAMPLTVFIGRSWVGGDVIIRRARHFQYATRSLGVACSSGTLDTFFDTDLVNGVIGTQANLALDWTEIIFWTCVPRKPIDDDRQK